MIFNRITQTSLDASIVYHPETDVFATLLLESLYRHICLRSVESVDDDKKGFVLFV